MKLANMTIAGAMSCPPICISAYPKVLIAGDSTVATYEGGPLQGWGALVPKFLNLSVLNFAKNGRSTRSFINDGLWKKVLDLTYPGDFVVIEFGHNDPGDPTAKNNTRAFRNTLPGTGDESVKVQFMMNATLLESMQGRAPSPPPGYFAATLNKTEVVHTYGWYLKNMIVDVRDKGGVPILSSRTPGYDWRPNNSESAFMPTKYEYRDYTKKVADELKADFVDHTYYSVLGMVELGSADTKEFFPKDYTHFSSKGAEFFAQSFIRAARCGKSQIAKYLNDEGQSVSGGCLQAKLW